MFEIYNRFAETVVSKHRTAKGAAKAYYRLLKRFRKNNKHNCAICNCAIWPLEIKKENKNLYFWEDQGDIGLTKVADGDYQILCIIPC